MLTRRNFLASGAALLASSALPRLSFGADLAQTDFFSAEENATRVRRVLQESWVLARGEVVRDLDIIIPQDFRRTPAEHAITMHPEGNQIRNVRILFETDLWQDRWLTPLHQQPMNALSSYVSGLHLPATAHADVDGLHIEGSPRWGIEGVDVTDLRIRRYSSTRCFGGAFFGEHPGGSGNHQWDVDQVRVWDTWGPPGGYPSRVRPGGWIGGDSWVSEGDLILLSRMEISGECAIGAKFSRGRWVVIRDLTTPSVMFQGSSLPDPALPGLDRLYVQGLFVNAATGYGPGADDANKVQVSWNVEAQMDGGYIIGNGRDGNAIQATGNCHLDVRNFWIAGFNGFRGAGNPAHALELDVREPVSTINADFESANQFVNQGRILRRAD